jgi:mannosyltransferase
VTQASRDVEQHGSTETTIRSPQTGLQRIAQRLPQRLLLCVGLCVIALGFNLYRLGAPSIWFDEAFSVELARQPLPLLWHIIFDLEPNMELYYLFLHFWLGLTALFGLHATEFVVRFPSAIFAALSVGVVFLWGQRFLNTTAGVVAAALYLLNYLQLIYTQQTRAYSLQLLLTCLAWYALFAALTSTTHARRWWIGYTIVTVLAIYTHIFSGLILIAQLVAVAGIVLASKQRRSEALTHFKTLVICLVAVAILIIPMLLVSLQGAKTGWLPIPHRQELIGLFLILGGYHKIYLVALVICIALSVALVASRRFLPRLAMLMRSDIQAQQFSNTEIIWSLLCWLLIPIVVSFVVSHSSLRLFSDRYLVTIVPPLCLLMALGISLFRWRLVRVVLALGVIAIALTPVPLYYRSAQVEDWNVATRWVQQHYRDGDGLVCYDNSLQQGCQVSVEYYLHAYPSAAHFTSDSPGPFSWQTFESANPDAAVDPTVLSSFGAKHARIIFIVGRIRDDAAAARFAAAQHWLDSHYHRADQFETRTVRVYLYDTK